MKHKKNHRNHSHNIYQSGPIYPNAADPSYFTNKALNALAIIVSSMGFVTAMVFLVNLA